MFVTLSYVEVEVINFLAWHEIKVHVATRACFTCSFFVPFMEPGNYVKYDLCANI